MLSDTDYERLTTADWRRWWEYHDIRKHDKGNPALTKDKSGTIHVHCIDCKAYLGSEDTLGYHRAIRTMRCKECAAAKRRWDDAARHRWGRAQTRQEKKAAEQVRQLQVQTINLQRDVIRELREDVEKYKTLLRQMEQERSPQRAAGKALERGRVGTLNSIIPQEGGDVK